MRRYYPGSAAENEREIDLHIPPGVSSDEGDGEGRPVAYNRVAGIVVTGNEDGAPT